MTTLLSYRMQSVAPKGEAASRRFAHPKGEAASRRFALTRAFTLIEMLIVIGIIAVLTGAAIAGYSTVVARAQKTKAEEQVHEILTALVQVMQKEDAWPRAILAEGGNGGEMTPAAGAALAKRGALSLTYRQYEDNGETRYELSGVDKFGVVDPWAMEVIKNRFKSASLSLSTKVPSGGNIRDHRYRFAVDDDYDGKVRVSGDGVSATVRASAAVWGAGRDGKFGTRDDVRSWAYDQEER